MREYLCIALLLVMILALIPGCGGATEAEASQAQAPRQLRFVIVNRSGGKIDQVGISGANIPMGFRAIEQNGRSELKHKDLTLPEKLTLHWSDSRGERHEGTVGVWSELGGAYSGSVVLTITQRGKVILTGG